MKASIVCGEDSSYFIITFWVGHEAAFRSLEAALHGAHIGVGIKSRLKFLCVDLAVFVQDMRIDFRDHVNLCMAGISLGGFEIPFVQFQLVGRAGVM